MKKLKYKEPCETNAQRAKNMGLKPAPTLKGYFFPHGDTVELLAANLERTANGQPPQFKQLFVETINACNLRCPMCYTAANGEQGRAKTEFLEWKRTILAAKELGIETVAVAGRGEPLLDDKFWELGKFVREQDLDFLVFTNGMLTTPDIAKRLQETCTTLITKLFALTPDAHDKLVGIKGAYQKTREALRHMLDVGMREPNLAVDLVITKQNLDDLQTVLRMCRMFGIIPYFEQMGKIGKAEKLNGNMFVPVDKTRELFKTLREIDETEFGLTWAIPEETDALVALTHCGGDKRMYALHLDVFGNVHAGLETEHIIGNIRNHEQGIEGILQETGKWHTVFQTVADGIELEVLDEKKERTPEITADATELTHPQKLLAAVEKIRELQKKPTKCDCGFGTKRKPVPTAVTTLTKDTEAKLEGTDYEETFIKLKKLLLAKNTFLRVFGEILLGELIYGKRHVEVCNPTDLGRYEWETYGVEGHIRNDPIMNRFAQRLLTTINDDYICPCLNQTPDMLKYFLKQKLEYAAINLVKMCVPDVGKNDPKNNQRHAERFGKTIQVGTQLGLPMFWNLAYEHTGGMKDIPKNPAYFDIVTQHAGNALAQMAEGLERARDPIQWLQENTACVFVGANDLGSLAGFLYHQNVERDAAARVLQLLATNRTLRAKLKVKAGIPKHLF